MQRHVVPVMTGHAPTLVLIFGKGWIVSERSLPLKLIAHFLMRFVALNCSPSCCTWHTWQSTLRHMTGATDLMAVPVKRGCAQRRGCTIQCDCHVPLAMAIMVSGNSRSYPVCDGL